MPSTHKTDPCQSPRPPQGSVLSDAAAEPVAARTMASTKKVRLVVGLFSTADELALGLAELGARRLKPERITVVAQANGLQGALEGCLENRHAQGFGTWIVCAPRDGPLPWALAAIPRQPNSADAEQDVRALLGLHHWALRRQAHQLDRHLRAGGALLLVEPETDTEERSACTALLRHASGGVQTHEIARPQAS